MLPLPYLYYRYLLHSYTHHTFITGTLVSVSIPISLVPIASIQLFVISISMVHVPMPAFISFNHIQRTWFVSSLRCTNNEFKVNSREIISASDCHIDLHTLGCKNMQEREAWYQCRELIIWQVHSDSTTLTETMDLHCTYQLCSLGCRHICHSY